MITIFGIVPALAISGFGVNILPLTIFVALTGAALSTGMT